MNNTMTKALKSGLYFLILIYK